MALLNSARRAVAGVRSPARVRTVSLSSDQSTMVCLPLTDIIQFQAKLEESWVNANPIKGSRGFLQQPTYPSMLSTGWFYEKILMWSHNQIKVILKALKLISSWPISLKVNRNIHKNQLTAKTLTSAYYLVSQAAVEGTPSGKTNLAGRAISTPSVAMSNITFHSNGNMTFMPPSPIQDSESEQRLYDDETGQCFSFL